MAKKRTKKKKAKIPAIGKIPDTGPVTEIREATTAEARIQKLKVNDPDLYNRCRKEIGMSDAMVASYSSAEALLQAANGMHPKSNVDARISEGKPPEPAKFEENMPDSFMLESVLEAKFIKTNRDHYDRGNLQAFLRRINRRYGPQEPVRIIEDKSFKVVQRELVTKYTMYFKE